MVRGPFVPTRARDVTEYGVDVRTKTAASPASSEGGCGYPEEGGGATHRIS